MKPQDPLEEGKQTMKNETKKTQPKYTLRKQTLHIFDPGFDVISSVRAWKRTCINAGNVVATLRHVRHAENDVLPLTAEVVRSSWAPRKAPEYPTARHSPRKERKSSRTFFFTLS